MGHQPSRFCMRIVGWPAHVRLRTLAAERIDFQGRVRPRADFPPTSKSFALSDSKYGEAIRGFYLFGRYRSVMIVPDGARLI
jgi:hypothetical protein